jgi:transposase
MQLKTLLNRVHPVKGFVYEKHQLVEEPQAPNGVRLMVKIRPRRGSQAICGDCGRRGPSHDRLPERRFKFVPLWGIAVTFMYAMRRVHCPDCGTIQVERVPWSDSKRPMTKACEWFLADWARRLSWKEVSEVFSMSWDCVFRSVKSVVNYGLAHRDLSGIEAIGVDEVAYAKGHRYATLVYQLDEGMRRLLHIAESRQAKSLLSFFRMLKKKAGTKAVESIRFVCSDMWKPYLKVIRKKLPKATHILDRYHIVASLNRALDKIRAEEARRLKAEGYEAHLHQTRWCFLKRKENLTAKQHLRLREVLRYDLKTVRAYLKIQAFQWLWDYTSPTWAGKFLDAWCRDVMRSRLEPLKNVAKSLRKHRQLILNWFEAKKQYNAGIVEGLNANVKLRFRKAYGFRTFEAIEVALYHELGDLPLPPTTHKFC